MKKLKKVVQGIDKRDFNATAAAVKQEGSRNLSQKNLLLYHTIKKLKKKKQEPEMIQNWIKYLNKKQERKKLLVERV